MLDGGGLATSQERPMHLVPAAGLAVTYSSALQLPAASPNSHNRSPRTQASSTGCRRCVCRRRGHIRRHSAPVGRGGGR